MFVCVVCVCFDVLLNNSWAAIQAGEVKYQSMKLLTLANRVSAPHTTNINNDNNNNKGNSGGDDGASPRDVNQENRNVNAPAAPLAVKRAVPDPLALLPRKITTASVFDFFYSCYCCFVVVLLFSMFYYLLLLLMCVCFCCL